MAIARTEETQPVPESVVLNVAPTRRLFTVHEYHKLGEVGILTEDDRVELIDGIIYDMPPIGEEHFGNVNRFTDQFYVFRGRAVIHVQNPVRLGLRNEPQPDVTLLRFREDYYAGKFPEPEDVLLLVEVADSSLGHDRNTKQRLYADAGISEYWVVDLAHGELIVYRDPGEGEYRSMQRLSRGDTVTPIAFQDVTLAVTDLLGRAPETQADATD